MDNKPEAPQDRPMRDPKTGQFKVGHTGIGGRPKGARSKLGEAFLEDLQASWEKHGKDVIRRVIEERPQDFLKVVAGLLPKDLNLNINPLENMTDAELVARYRQVQKAAEPFIDAVERGETKH